MLKKKSPLMVSSTYGQSYTHFLGNTLTDGKNVQFDFTKGFDLGKKGVINVSAQYLGRGYTDRGGEDTRPLLYSGFRSGRNVGATKEQDETEAQYQAAYRQAKNADDAKAQLNGLSRHNMRVGNSEMTNFGVFLNGEYALTPNLSAYGTLGFSRKNGKAGGFYRLPSQTSQVDLTLYPNGYLPFINTAITDFSAIAGLRGELGKWSFDISNTYGTNIIGFRITNTMNASLPAGTSPAAFDAGTLSFAQNTVNLDLSRRLTFDRTLTALNIAFGSEFRTDNYIIKEGEELSWSIGQPSKGIAGVPGNAAGAQVFPGFQPSNALNKSRRNVALYADFEQEFGPKLLTEVAGRFEHYSDFGSNLSGKAAARWKVFKDIALRGALASGFRAPSLHQHYFNNISTQFVQGNPTQVMTANNNVARQFGAGDLKPEISTSYSAGIAGKIFKKIIFSIDAYQIDIRDRIVFSSQYTREREANGNRKPGPVNQILDGVDPPGVINSVQFFTNAINTRTRGLDIVASDKFVFGKHSLTATAAANFNKTEVKSVNPPGAIAADASLTQNLFNRQERGRYEMGIPRSKINLGLTYAVSKYSLLLRTVRFGMVG
ncbi:MAG: TonB-dependent receptor, partial [Candidatus Nephrothrix sp. EaCA]